jgi:ubiquinone/menaquinone biosynthesis C-methylase UbiE
MKDISKSVEIVSEPWRNSPYYADAEGWTWMFWDAESPFRRFFDRLDVESMVELACGHGRHAEKIAARAGRLALMDVLPENIEVCRQRFARFANIECFVNSGVDFQPLGDASVSAIYCYDAMVHFSPDIVEAYLHDTARVLRSGGMALYHHSNYPAPFDRHYGHNPHARNHMTKALSSTLAQRSGLAVIEQRLLDWGNVEGLDCLSLVARATTAIPASNPT